MSSKKTSAQEATTAEEQQVTAVESEEVIVARLERELQHNLKRCKILLQYGPRRINLPYSEFKIVEELAANVRPLSKDIVARRMPMAKINNRHLTRREKLNVRIDLERSIAIMSGYAYNFALLVDKKARDDTRDAAILEGNGFYYARNIDKSPRQDTREAAIREQKALEYAVQVDQCSTPETRAAAISKGDGIEYCVKFNEPPSEETRNAAIKQKQAYLYAKYVDKGPHPLTRQAVLTTEQKNAVKYAVFIDQQSTEDMKAAALAAGNGFEWALFVDKKPSDITRQNAIENYCAYEYARWVDQEFREDTFQAVLDGISHEKSKDILRYVKHITRNPCIRSFLAVSVYYKKEYLKYFGLPSKWPHFVGTLDRKLPLYLLVGMWEESYLTVNNTSTQYPLSNNKEDQDPDDVE